MLLDCLHSVCGVCFAAAVTARALLNCPTCHLPSRTHDRAHYRDYVAEHFLAVSEAGRVAHLCAVHGDEHGDEAEPATFYCGGCSRFMCSACTADHRQQTPHTPVLVEDLTPEMVSLPVTCPVHRDNLIIGYCMTCKKGVCSSCVTSDDQTHHIVTTDLETSVIPQVYRMLDEELARPVPPSKLNGVATTLNTLDGLIAAGTTNVHTQHAVIDDWARDGSAAVRARAEELRNEVVAKWDVRRKALSMQRHDVASRVHAFTHARTYTTALRRIGTALEVLTVSGFLQQRVGALRSWLHLIDPCVSRDAIAVTLDPAGKVRKVAAHGHISEPRISPWLQGLPPRSCCGDIRIYAVGGSRIERNHLATIERYDPSRDTWEAVVHPIPSTRHVSAGAPLSNHLYVMSGSDLDPSRGNDVIDVFDPASNTWQQGAYALLTIKRFRPVFVSFGAHIFAIGGHNPKGAVLAAVERYDAMTKKWETRSGMIASRRGLACAVLDGFIYATGGQNRRVFHLRSAERYDPVRDCWERVNDMPVGRVDHAAAALEGHLYVIGGAIEGKDCTTRVDRFDPTLNEWERVAPLAVGRIGLAAVTAGDRIYAIGGTWRIQDTAEVEAYDATKNSWTHCSSMPTPRAFLTAAVLDMEEASDVGSHF